MPKGSTIRIGWVLSLVSLVLMGAHAPIRDFDAVLLSYLRHREILRADTLLFDPLHYSMWNTYLLQHRLLDLISRISGSGVERVATGLTALTLIAAAAGVVQMMRVLSRTTFDAGLFGLILLFNVNFMNICGTEYLATYFFPQNLATVASLFFFTSYMQKAYGRSVLYLALIGWLHVPTAIFIGLPFGAVTLVSGQARSAVQQDKHGIAAGAILGLPVLAMLVIGMLLKQSSPAPDWVLESQRQAYFGHISLAYRWAILGVAHNVGAVAGLVATVAFCAIAVGRHGLVRCQTPRERLAAFIVASAVLLAILVVAVDAFRLQSIYILQPLRFAFFPAMLGTALLIASRPKWSSRRWSWPLNDRMARVAWIIAVSIGVIFTVRQVPFYAGRLADAALWRTGIDRDWVAIASHAAKLPASSIVLVPYDKTDFYAHSPRLTPFNRIYLGMLIFNPYRHEDVRKVFDDFVQHGFLPEAVVSGSNRPQSIPRIHSDAIMTAWRNLTVEDIRRLKEKYAISHVIAEHDRGWQSAGKPIAETGRYVLIQLSQ